MSGAGKTPAAAGPSGVVEWVSSACRFATDRNDFRRGKRNHCCKPEDYSCDNLKDHVDRLLRIFLTTSLGCGESVAKSRTVRRDTIIDDSTLEKSMTPLDPFIGAARQHLRVGKKPLSIPRSRELATLVMAVDLGLKPALLYDVNAALVEQVQTYLTSLQSEQLVSRSLLTLSINEHILIANQTLTIANLEQLFRKKTVAVMDVSPSLDQPVISDLLGGDVEDMIQALLSNLREFGQESGVNGPLCIGELSETWNLCTLFGILLGYPATYWFDHKKSFENCLTMTPLVVTKALATWKVDTESHRCCLYSFSTPEVLEADTQSVRDDWTSRLQERFQKQTFFSGLDFSRTTVILPSVTL